MTYSEPDNLCGEGGDRGDIDPELRVALTTGDSASVRRAMLAARVLVPVVALGADSSEAEMAVPGLVGADGRQALPVFSCLGSLQAWRADARPVLMPGSRAMLAARAEGYAAVVLDVAGPVAHVVEGDDLELLADAAAALAAGTAATVHIIATPDVTTPEGC